MIAPQQRQPIRQRILRPMPKRCTPTSARSPLCQQMRQIPIPRNLPQANHHLHLSQQQPSPPSGARAQLRISCGVGLSPGGAHRTTEPIHSFRSFKPSSRLTARGFVASPSSCSTVIHKVPGAIPRKRPPRAVRPMRPRRQPQHQDPRVRVAKPRHRLRPVHLVPIRLCAGLRRSRGSTPAVGDSVRR